MTLERGPQTPQAARPLRDVRIDARGGIGRLRSLQGISGPPRPPVRQAMTDAHFFEGWAPFLRWTGADVSDGYRRARIDLVRNHEMPGPGDIDARYSGEITLADGSKLSLAEFNAKVIFPNMDADPSDPASYNFGPTDELLKSIVDIGASIFFRIGRTLMADSTPPDPTKYAEIVKHVVMHYNMGWSDGFHYNIRYWEIWNEPDFNFGLGFWNGTPEQYYDLYEAVARAVKAVDPTLLVGGPATAMPTDSTPYREPFLRHARDRRIPLDFYSWHWYSNGSHDPFDFSLIADDLRRMLDEHGFAETLVVLNEWNCGIRLNEAVHLTSAGRASFMTTAALYMQDAPIDLALYYNGYTPFGVDGKSPNQVGHALIAQGMLQDTPLRLPLTGADQAGFAAIAGKSEDDKTIQILISNFEIPAEYMEPRPEGDVVAMPPGVAGGQKTYPKRRRFNYADNGGYDLRVEHLPPDVEYEIRRFRISDGDNFDLIAASRATGPTIHIPSAIPSPAIDLVIIRESAAGA